jgi:glycosyltransferase involved in cell wall biosynthesis
LRDSEAWRQSGTVIEVDLGEPLEPIRLRDPECQVLLLVRNRGSFVGQVWLRARTSPTLVTPEEQWQQIVRRLSAEVIRAEVRHHLTRRLATVEPAIEPPGVSVVICTHDRPETLGECLDSLEALQPAPLEIIVVDNAPSTDATRAICAGRAVRHVLEPQPGQTRARNRGIAVSRGELVAFTDDDCIADPAWLGGLARDFADPLVMARTGFIGPMSVDAPAQLLFEGHGGFERHPERRVFDGMYGSPVMAAATAGAGANMTFRRRVFDIIGPFAEHLGPGTPARSSDDKEAFYRLFAAGFRIVYDPARIVWHRHRATRGSLTGILRDYGTSEFAWTLDVLSERRELASLNLWRWWLRHFAAELKAIVKPPPDAIRLPPSLLIHEIAGASQAFGALRRSRRSRVGIEAVPLPPATPSPDSDHGDRDQGVRAVRVATAPPPPITLAIASYNRCAALQRTLRFVADQNVEADRLEVVVVLDGSTDDSAAMLDALELPFALRTVWQPNLGLAAARNRGAAEAIHPVVAFSDDDIHPSPAYVAAHARAHARSSQPSAVLGPYPPGDVGTSFAALGVRAWWSDHFRRLQTPGHRWSFTDICDGNLSIPVSLLMELGGFDETFAGGRRQDFEFGLRLLERGVPFSFEPEALGLHQFQVSTRTLLANARQEGRWDVVLTRKHPQVRRRLPLGQLSGSAWEQLTAPAPARSLKRGVATSGAPHLALDELEHLRLRGKWRGLFGRLWRQHYAVGIRDALPSDHLRREFLRDPGPPAPELVLALEADGRLEPEVAVAAPELHIQLRGIPLGVVPVIRPGGQWDLEDLIERSVHAASATAALAGVRALERSSG